MTKHVKKYLSRYREDECALLEDFNCEFSFSHVLAIPCFDEELDFIERLNNTPPAHPQNLLIILVVNQPQGTQCERNTKLLKSIEQWPTLWQRKHLSLKQSCINQFSNKNLFWFLVDRTQCALPKDQGVGLARKIAGDIACTLWHKGQIQSGWLYCTDADAHLPENYFLPVTGDFSAVVFDHKHLWNQYEPEVSQATKLYESALDYYVKGLRWAGSPFAFNTIGSCLAINLHSYCHARGFPKRAAAEDFYLLNKLAKLKPIAHQPEVCVTLASRLSHRVPFGTGPAVKSILDLNHPEQDYVYYSLDCFIALKEWLAQIPIVAVSGRDALQHCSPQIQQALIELDIKNILAHLHNQPPSSAKQAEAVIHNWFDAFKTLKFIRYLQQHYYPAQPLLDERRRAPFIHSTYA